MTPAPSRASGPICGVLAPGPNEIEEAIQLNAKTVLDNGKAINIKMLISLISKARLIISNDTGPAHIASHLNKKGLVLFGSHTSAKKVSIENSNFKRWKKYMEKTGINILLDKFISDEINYKQCSGFNFILKK